MMKSLLLMLAFSAVSLSGAQEVTPPTAEDLATLLGTEQADAVRSYEKALGKAFDRTLYQRVAAEILRSGQELSEPEKSDCPAAAAFANEALHRFDSDFDPELVLRKTETMLIRTDWETEAFDEEMRQLHLRLRKNYLPVLRARERQREKDLLAANALRREVTVLPNGLQYECEPGNDSIRDITRGTRETGILSFTRETEDTAFDELPDCVKAVADSLPRAASWTIYIPGEVLVADAEAKQKKAEEERARKEDKLHDLLGTAKPTPPRRPQRTETPTAPLIKLHVWKDDPNHPVEVLPDTDSRVF